MISFKKNFTQNISSKGDIHRITINGDTIEVVGNSITIDNNKIYVDGKLFNGHRDLENKYKPISIVIEGDVESIETECSVSVNGNVKGKICAGGSISINGDVEGNLNAGGSVKIKGAHSGSIVAGGSVKTGF